VCVCVEVWRCEMWLSKDDLIRLVPPVLSFDLLSLCVLFFDFKKNTRSLSKFVVSCCSLFVQCLWLFVWDVFVVCVSRDSQWITK